MQCLFLSKKCLRLRYWMASPGDASCIPSLPSHQANTQDSMYSPIPKAVCNPCETRSARQIDSPLQDVPHANLSCSSHVQRLWQNPAGDSMSSMRTALLFVQGIQGRLRTLTTTWSRCFPSRFEAAAGHFLLTAAGFLPIWLFAPGAVKATKRNTLPSGSSGQTIC